MTIQNICCFCLFHNYNSSQKNQSYMFKPMKGRLKINSTLYTCTTHKEVFIPSSTNVFFVVFFYKFGIKTTYLDYLNQNKVIFGVSNNLMDYVKSETMSMYTPKTQCYVLLWTQHCLCPWL